MERVFNLTFIFFSFPSFFFSFFFFIIITPPLGYFFSKKMSLTILSTFTLLLVCFLLQNGALVCGQTTVPPPSWLNLTTPPPDMFTCVNDTDVANAQLVFKRNGFSYAFLCARIAKFLGGWDGCVDTTYKYNLGLSITDAAIGNCNINCTVNIMTNRGVGLANTAQYSWSYFGTCYHNNFGMLLRCARNDCLPGTCGKGEVCLDYPDAVCYCNQTGTLVQGPCPAPNVTLPPPTASPSIPESLPIKQEAFPLDSIIILAGGFVLGCIVLIIILLLWKRRPKCQRWTLMTLYISILDLSTDLALCFTLWSYVTNPASIYTRIEVGPQFFLALSLLQTISVVVGGVSGIALATYLLWSEASDQKMRLWIEKNSSVVSSSVLLAALDPQNLYLFSSEITEMLSCSWSEKAKLHIDRTSAILLILRNIPQLVVQIALISVAGTSALPFIAMIVSVFGLLWGLGRRVASMAVWSKTTLNPTTRLASFRSSHTLSMVQPEGDFSNL